MADRISYSTAASGEVQANINRLSGQIQSIITQHQANVKAALADASMTGVTDAYREVEGRFNSAAEQTLAIIKSLKETLGTNDGIAATTQKKSEGIVNNMNG